MNDTQITVDFDALNEQVKKLRISVDNLTPVVEASRSTQGFASAQAFGVMCAGLGVAGGTASAVFTLCATKAIAALDSTITLAEAGLHDFLENEEALTQGLNSSMNPGTVEVCE